MAAIHRMSICCYNSLHSWYSVTYLVATVVPSSN